MNDTPNESSSFDTYALVELFGHQKIVGRVTEASLAGGAFLRVDVEPFEGMPGFTRFFSPGAIYSINPVEKAEAMVLMRQYRNEPISRFSFEQMKRGLPMTSQSEMDYQ